jgi:hypothetical protein
MGFVFQGRSKESRKKLWGYPAIGGVSIVMLWHLHWIQRIENTYDTNQHHFLGG